MPSSARTNILHVRIALPLSPCALHVEPHSAARAQTTYLSPLASSDRWSRKSRYTALGTAALTVYRLEASHSTGQYARSGLWSAQTSDANQCNRGMHCPGTWTYAILPSSLAPIRVPIAVVIGGPSPPI